MLPHALSNGVCSLVEEQDRLTKSVFLDYNAKGKLQNVEFANTVIRSRKRLTYRQALAFLEKNDFEEIRKTPLPPKHQTGSTGRNLEEVSNAEMKEIRDLVRGLWNIASRLRGDRMRKGSLDLDMEEVKIYVDENGYADRLETIDYDISHQLIEEFMLAANEAVAKNLRDNDIPSVYRVHDSPDDDKLQELQEYMATIGIQTGDLTQRKNMTALLAKLKDHPQGYSLRIQVLRSLKQACYRNSPDGHSGLHKTNYTQFTSPIRRFSDFIVHQQFERLLKKSGHPTASDSLPFRNTQKSLQGLGEHLSLTERNSQDAERESVKTKLLEFFERELKKDRKTPFEAVSVDLKNHGIFVELTGSMAFGLIHVSTIRDDIYKLNSSGTALIGRRRKKSFEIGDTLKVTVESVDRYKRQIDFQIA
jgi:ribonuclease R